MFYTTHFTNMRVKSFTLKDALFLVINLLQLLSCVVLAAHGFQSVCLDGRLENLKPLQRLFGKFNHSYDGNLSIYLNSPGYKQANYEMYLTLAISTLIILVETIILGVTVLLSGIYILLIFIYGNSEIIAAIRKEAYKTWFFVLFLVMLLEVSGLCLHICSIDDLVDLNCITKHIDVGSCNQKYFSIQIIPFLIFTCIGRSFIVSFTINISLKIKNTQNPPNVENAKIIINTFLENYEFDATRNYDEKEDVTYNEEQYLDDNELLLSSVKLH